ncbi:MAG TPA: helix-turn-helix transcriptional regulator [Pseudonocardiaceae bacterium]|jgi:transcriptional regulator with XRE-family HTH domain|nr:helix-turn-helix transcriptional regulator [Pseudonocardiaceae bacterium]
MATTTLRTAKRLLLGHELRYLREQARLTQTDVAKMIESRAAKITDLEKGQAVITPGDLILVAQGLGVTDQGHLDALMELRRDYHKRGFWTTGYLRGYHEDFRLMVELEQHADLIRSVDVEAMPGLGQCEAYVRAMFGQRASSSEDEVTIEDFVQARLARQRLVVQDEPLEYQAVLSESCLRREFGGTAVMREQIDHLIALSKRSNMIVQVIPFKTRPVGQVAIRNGFQLVRVPSPGAAGPLEVAYTEGEGDIRYLDDKRALIAHDNAWARLVAGALNPADSRKFMREVAAELK